MNRQPRRRAPLPAPAPGVVKVRLSGEMTDISRAAEMLTQAGAEVLDASGPRTNREDPGVRVYLTVRISPAEGMADGNG